MTAPARCLLAVLLATPTDASHCLPCWCIARDESHIDGRLPKVLRPVPPQM